VARILVIDHDTPIRDLLREVLEGEGYSVVEAHNGYEGLQQDQPAPPAMVMSDIMYLVAF
jgi:CheY-like chemotaxis protein